MSLSKVLNIQDHPISSSSRVELNSIINLQGCLIKVTNNVTIVHII